MGVVLWFRREDITTTDPDDGQGETSMLTELNGHPHLVHLHIILPHHMDGEVNNLDWQSYAPDLIITFHTVRDFQTNARQKFQEIDDSAKAAAGKVDDKKREQGKRFDEECKLFHKKSAEIIALHKRTLQLTAKQFHLRTVSQGDLRKALEDGLKALKGYCIIDTTFKVPDEKFMMVRFLATANDAGVNRDGKKVWAKSINEFEARVFVLQVMLGQTIAKAKEIAMNFS